MSRPPPKKKKKVLLLALQESRPVHFQSTSAPPPPARRVQVMFFCLESCFKKDMIRGFCRGRLLLHQDARLTSRGLHVPIPNSLEEVQPRASCLVQGHSASLCSVVEVGSSWPRIFQDARLRSCRLRAPILGTLEDGATKSRLPTVLSSCASQPSQPPHHYFLAPPNLHRSFVEGFPPPPPPAPPEKIGSRPMCLCHAGSSKVML